MYSVVVQSLSRVRLFVTPVDCSMPDIRPAPSLRVGSSPSAVSQWRHQTLSLSPLPLLLSIFRVLLNELALCIRWPKHWSFASASVLPISSQNWFPLGLTGLISSLSKGLSRVVSSTTIQNINSSALSLLYGPNLTPIYVYWKIHSSDYTDLCWQNDVSAF